jgi:hypothetical protein
MPADKRVFEAGISVRVGTRRHRFELARAEDYGGPEGFYRVRLGRRWVAGFFDRERLARLIAATALGALPCVPDKPNIPCNTRVTVKHVDDEPVYAGAWTGSEPILDHKCRWVVLVYVEGRRVFVPVDELVVHKR